MAGAPAYEIGLILTGEGLWRRQITPPFSEAR
jgi:hypothetical protein